jgi:hypothetical protein
MRWRANRHQQFEVRHENLVFEMRDRVYLRLRLQLDQDCDAGDEI